MGTSGEDAVDEAFRIERSEIVRAFEAEGFIWGGKWHEYDLMHFEYRPEIMAKARLLHQLEDNKSNMLE